MNLPKVFAVVASIHVLVVAVLLVQPGCQSVSQNDAAHMPTGAMGSARSMDNRPLSPDINQGVTTAAQEVPAQEEGEMRLPPTRPTWDMSSNESQAHEDNLSQPLQPLAKADSVTGTSYTVKKGDSLWSIAQRSGVSVATLAAANNLSPKASLKLGQVLTIPGKDAAQLASVASAQSTPASPSDISQESTLYTVHSGDSLSKIASRTGTTVAALKAMNGLNSDSIRVGQKLMIPSKSGSTAAVVKSTPTIKPIEHPVNYTVQSGDTLSGIASRFGLKSAEIMAWNNIQDPRQLRAGQVLTLDGGKTVSSASSTSSTASSAPERTAKSDEEAMPEVAQVDDSSSGDDSGASDTADTGDDDMAMDAAEDVPVVPVDHTA